MRDPSSGVLVMWIVAFGGLYWGPPVYRNYHIALLSHGDFTKLVYLQDFGGPTNA